MKKPYEMTIEEIKAMYFPETTTAEESVKKHLLYLAEVETWRQNNTYPTASDFFKANSVKRVQHYIDINTPQGKAYEEYQTFIEAMEKSIGMCSQHFASAGSCFAPEKYIRGVVENQITFVSDEFTATNDSQEFWDKLREYAHSINRYVILVY